MAPSRELVTQIGQVAAALFNGTQISTLSVIGGANVKNQIKHLREDRPQILIATPGRLAELIFKLERIRLGMVKAIIVDEVDNMLQEPFLEEIQTIIESAPLFSKSLSEAVVSDTMAASENDGEELMDELDIDEIKNSIDERVGEYNNKLICLASATGDDPRVKEFADRYCTSGWRRINVQSEAMLPRGITHGLISTPRIKALEMLKKLLNSQPTVEKALIFVNDPHRVEIVAGKLFEYGLIAAPLHGDSSKDDRKVSLQRVLYIDFCNAYSTFIRKF